MQPVNNVHSWKRHRLRILRLKNIIKIAKINEINYGLYRVLSILGIICGLRAPCTFPHPSLVATTLSYCLIKNLLFSSITISKSRYFKWSDAFINFNKKHLITAVLKNRYSKNFGKSLEKFQSSYFPIWVSKNLDKLFIKLLLMERWKLKTANNLFDSFNISGA